MRIVILILLLLSVVGGHYFLHTTSLENIRDIQIILIAALVCLNSVGALFMALQSKGIRLRRLNAFQAGMIALAGLITIILYLQSSTTPSTKTILSPASMIYGNVYAVILCLYPQELMHPKWVTLRHVGLLFLPIALTGAIYYIGIRMQDAPIHEIYEWSTVVRNVWTFDIWFRLVIFIYPFVLFVWMLRNTIRYSKGTPNTPSKENESLSLLYNFDIGFFLIAVSYVIVIMANNTQCRMLHSLLFLGLTSYLLYQNIFNIHLISPARAMVYLRTAFRASDANSEAGQEQEHHCFVNKIPQYKEMLEQWMERDKPYKNPHFKLIDCMSILPLNRSYLSRLFNEGYNETFFSFVMRYRIDESTRLLEQHSELTVASISEMCGFSSPSVFGRAFQTHKGITPLQYRRRFGENNPENLTPKEVPVEV